MTPEPDQTGSRDLRVIVMGVSGSGKTVTGRELAAALGATFLDADDFHSPANVAKMAAGTPLTDVDRAGWLDDLAARLERHSAVVLACSALKASYRQRLCAIRGTRPIILYLDGSFDDIRQRLEARKGHYFQGLSMLRSQFDTLEPPTPDEAIPININAPLDAVVHACLQALTTPPQ
ncbi:gluconokinase [Roseicitreum antarcticum]|uniref:Gluconokinase n=1 Tax=Roseicitreum antarcticum TaxID=564137 RepID=A0A1H2TD55_9RHOB|nr:gluconokinase [Roseicitreum antarcticum]SDW41707.1 gluconokinase [Roseicitreum antarcticum]